MAGNDAAKRISNQLELNMDAYSISSNNDFDFIDTNNQRYKKFGITSGIVVLISPDGFVAWGSKTIHENPEHALIEVLSIILSVSKYVKQII